jgi:hypothetical protein
VGEKKREKGSKGKDEGRKRKDELKKRKGFKDENKNCTFPRRKAQLTGYTGPLGFPKVE